MAKIMRATRQGTATVAILLALACSDDEPTDTTGAYSLAVNPAVLTVSQGGSGVVTVTLTRIGGFGGPVTLAVSGLPAGITTTITPAQLSGASASATIDVAVAGTVAIANYTATITASAQGVGQVTLAFQVAVTAAQNFALSIAPAALTIVSGTSGNATVSIDRSNFTGGVALALLNPPTGITGAFNSTPSTTNASALVVSVAANAAAGNHTLTIEGTATGPGARTTSLAVTVVAPPSGGNVEFLFCGTTEVPEFFAFQDGSSAWQAVTGSTSGGSTRFAFHLTQQVGGVLAVYRTASLGLKRVGSVLSDRRVARRQALLLSSMADAYQTEVLYTSAAQLAEYGAANCAQTQPTKSISGTVVGVAAGGYAFLALGSSGDIFDGAVSANPVTFTEVPAGPVDFLGARVTAAGQTPDKILLFRDLNIPDGGTLPSPIDFNGSLAVSSATANVTVTGAPGEELEIYSSLVTANSDLGLWSELGATLGTNRRWAGLPSGAMRAGDFHGLIVFASPPGDGDFRVALKYVGPVADQSLALGPALELPAASPVVAGAYPRLRFQGSLPAEYSKGASVVLASTLSPVNGIGIFATGAWLAAAGNALAYDFTMPDVAGLPGFPIAARLTAGTNLMFLDAWGFTAAGIFDPRPTLGTEFKAAARVGEVIVP